MNLTSISYLHEIGSKKNQEDYIWPAPGTAELTSRIFIVCDGVGGSENGEVASRMIAEYMGNTLAKTTPEKISTSYINQLLAVAKEDLVDHAHIAGLNKDMATTFSLLVLFNGRAFIAWCGDSRVYHIRNGTILYKTSDHSLVNSLVKSGDITEQEALTHPRKNVILKAITGDETHAEADGHWVEDIAGGDYFMLCTDGLLENITDADLNILLAGSHSDNNEIVAAMQEKCLGKTRDNYSMYLLQADKELNDAPSKRKTRFSLTGLVITALVVAAAGLFLFIDNNTAGNGILPATVNNDSAGSPVKDSVANKDTILQPGKSAIPDSEINKEDPDEQKIAPAPLPETKLIPDSMHKGIHLKKKAGDTVFVNPKTLIKNSRAAPKKDSVQKPENPIN